MILSDTPIVPPAILEICEQIVASLGFVLVEARTQGKSKNLEITIFHPQKVLSTDDCENVSRKLYAQLEAQQPSYSDLGMTIDVQSPGIDRRLKTHRDFEAFIGQTVEISLSSKLFDISDCFICRLAAFDGKSIVVDELTPQFLGKQRARQSVATPPSNNLSLDLNQVNTVKLSEQTLRNRTAPAA
jgi:ribosome maturation factor RimP